MEIQASNFIIRPYRTGDEDSLQRNADNVNVAANLTDAFPHPYTPEVAREWIELCQSEDEPGTRFAIVRDDEVIGGIGCEFQPRCSTHAREIGYWLGEDYWGQGIASEAVRLFVPWVSETFDLTRIQAEVFDWNPGSSRVLEKNGFELEGRLRKAIQKNGGTGDILLYGRLR